MVLELHPRTVRILGNAGNLASMPPPPIGVEVWCCNQRLGYDKWLPRIVAEDEWTRWFNLHSLKHIRSTYPRDLIRYKTLTKPIFMQKMYEDIPASQPFPRHILQAYYGTPEQPFRYFTCSVAWLIALAIYEKFERIELWGVEIAKRKPAFAWERACCFYWINKARELGITVWYPAGLDWDLSEAGNPDTYTGPLYGFETKPEEP